MLQLLRQLRGEIQTDPLPFREDHLAFAGLCAKLTYEAKMRKAAKQAELEGTYRRNTRLRRLERAGEAISYRRSHWGPLPKLRLAKPVDVQRIVKAAKR
jgi:hypothetical protein